MKIIENSMLISIVDTSYPKYEIDLKIEQDAMK